MDYRLKNKKDWDKVFKNGKRVYTSTFSLIYIENKEECLKVGFAVGKKHGGSVKRNRIKRLFRESFRTFIPQLKQNFFFVFIPKTDVEFNLETIKKDMQYALSKGLQPIKC